jgi:hypothetical protein
MSGDETSYLQVGDDGDDDDDDVTAFQTALHDLASHLCVAEGRCIPCDGEVSAPLSAAWEMRTNPLRAVNGASVLQRREPPRKREPGGRSVVFAMAS